MERVKIRRYATLGAAGVIVGSILISKLFAAQKEDPKTEEEDDTAPLVEHIVVDLDTVSTAMELTGRLISEDRVDVYAEVTGRLMTTGKQFKEGARFNRGEVLLRLDNSDGLMNLIATRANFQSALTQILADIATDYPDAFDVWNNYVLNFDPESRLPELPEVNDQKLKNFLVANKIYNQFYSIRSQEIQLSKYIVLAPFSGVVHNANVTPGTLVRAGQTLGQFISTESFELELGISLEDISKVDIGDKVLLRSSDLNGEWIGKISREAQAIDRSTQTIKIYVSVSGKGLSEGLFMTAEIGGKNVPGGTVIPSNLLLNDEFVYAIDDDSTLYRLNVTMMHELGDEIIVRGIPDGTKILGQAMTTAKEGMKVRLK